MILSDLGEVKLIKKIREWVDFKDKKIILPIGDDVAAFKVDSQKYLILTTDSFVEGTHFDLSYTSFFQVGYHSLAASLSDIASSGGLPLYAFVSLGLFPSLEVKSIEEIYRGMLSLCEKFKLKIIGGDTTFSEKLFLSLAIVGEVEPKCLRKRSEAENGDLVLVTGELGKAAAGLSILQNPSIKGLIRNREELIKAHLEPFPRIHEGRTASQMGAKAMEDISDGLASELIHIARESKVGIEIEENKIPLAPGVSEVAIGCGKKPLDLAFYGGEDYELVFTSSPKKALEIKKEIEEREGTRVSIIGRVVEREGVFLLSEEGKRTPLHYGYDHFKKLSW